MAITTFPIKLISASLIAPGVRELVFQRNDEQALDYIPGQFISIHFEKDGEALKRSYSIANSPNDDHTLSIAIANVPGGAASKLLFEMEPGDTIDASGPYGRLILKEDDIKRYVFVATGTGITPYRAMLPELSERLASQNINAVIVYGVQHREDLLYGAEFIDFADKHSGFEFRAQFSREQLSDPKPHEYTGYVQTAFDQLKLNPDSDIIYLCGNPDMIDDAFENLKAAGFETRSVRREKYISGR